MQRRTAAAAHDEGAPILTQDKVPMRKTRRKRVSSHAAYSVREIVSLFLALCVMLVCIVFVAFKISSTVDNHSGHMHYPRKAEAAGESREGNSLPYNPIYQVPEVHPSVGDRSDRYAELRKTIDPLLPDDATRSLTAMSELRTITYTTQSMDEHNSDQVPYDIMDCPDTPPAGYPFAWNIMNILQSWPPDDPTPRPNIYQGLCVFDFQKDFTKALAYRTAEKPFVVVNDPAIAKSAERWNIPGYMNQLLGDEEHRCEYSPNNHFMYYTPLPNKQQHVRGKKKVPAGWTAPTQKMWMPYQDWLDHANVTMDKLGPGNPHWYYRLIGCGVGMGNDGHCDKSASEYLYDELPFFQPKEGLYLAEPDTQMGIHCRFGMRGVIAENHYDGSRNTIAVLKGSRRYILTHPDQCSKLALYPKGHPSGRHSAVDWSHPDLEAYPEFASAKANEIILQPGELLYLPTEWFHFIVSLELNFQCNTRSGIGPEYQSIIRSCGF